MEIPAARSDTLRRAARPTRPQKPFTPAVSAVDTAEQPRGGEPRHQFARMLTVIVVRAPSVAPVGEDNVTLKLLAGSGMASATIGTTIV